MLFRSVLQVGTGILLRQNGIHVMRHFLQDHERLLLSNFVFSTIISHFATFALQIRKKFCEEFVIIKAKKGTMRGLNKIYYAILYNMHIACQITSSTIQLYAIYAKKEKIYESVLHRRRCQGLRKRSEEHTSELQSR